MRRTIIGFIITCALGCLFVAPLAAEAQPPTHVHRIGVLSSGTTPGRDPYVEAFLEGMRALGYVEGQNLVLEYRGAEGQYERFPDLAAELVRLQVDVLRDVGPTPAALAAKHATTTIPIVMAGVGDPVGSGLVASLARPGGNVTGLASLTPNSSGNSWSSSRTCSPPSPAWPSSGIPPIQPTPSRCGRRTWRPRRLGVQLHLLEARGPEAFDSAFAAMTSAPAGALLVLGDPMFLQHRSRLAELAAMSHLPTMYNTGVCGGRRPHVLWAERA